MIKRMLLLLVLVVFFTGCTVQPETAGDTTPSPAPEKTKVDSYQSLVDALRLDGATIEPGGNVEQPFFKVPGQVIRVNGQDVQVFEYENEAARQVDSSQISSDGSTIGTSIVTWMDTPHFWAKGKTIVLYIGKNQATVDLLNQVLGSPITKP